MASGTAERDLSSLTGGGSVCSEGSSAGVCVVRGTGGGRIRASSHVGVIGLHIMSADHYRTCPLVGTTQIFMSCVQQRRLEREEFQRLPWHPRSCSLPPSDTLD